ncbi:MAG TPA: DAK2 domain-containing protein, partial [Negativicutes bacterium]|nr:DAK2 domain-containing protein [Negativicutes bacterium]
GDTGTNLLLTLGAIRQALVGPVGDAGIGQISRRAADSAIMGARGNSGVILAQIFRGFARGLAGKEVATSSEIGKAFQYGILYAYRAVARPVEGTILTVAKGIAKGTRRAVRENLSFADILRRAVKTGRTELARTPELLPALKQAGVVDAGGLGLITLLEGCLTGLEGRYRSPEADFETILTLPESAGEITLSHPYCTEFLVKNAAVNAKEARRQLESLGDSLIVAATEEAVKVHIHTARPGSVLEIGLAWGSLHDVKIDNMADQHRSSPQATGRQTGLAVISVSPGPGLSEIMRKMGRAIIIDGGQTMNPPVEDFVNAVHGGSAEQYIILPNNANIILAATQAQKLLGNRVAVVPTRNVPQGLAALVAFDPQVDLTDNAARMSQRVAAVRAAGLTCAVRSCEIDGVKVRAGQYIGVADDKTVTAGDDLAAVLGDVIRMLVGTDTELISLYYGTTLSSEKAAALAAEITAVFPDIELELYDGGQPHYLFLIGTE